MFFGLTMEKLVLFAVIAAMVIGPERLPAFASTLASTVKRLKSFTTTGVQRVRDELGPEFDDTNWRTLDPRQYDPRRIISEALLDTAPPAPPTAPVSTASHRPEPARTQDSVRDGGDQP